MLAPLDPYDSKLSDAINAAVSRICAALELYMPLAGDRVLAWMKHLAGGAEPAAYYHHLRGSPMFLFPWFLEKTLAGTSGSELQSDIVYSTVNGYYWVRLIDNLTDGQATTEMQLLPALGFFHTGFERAYAKHFDAAHPFWDFFAATWFHSADVTIRDSTAMDFDRAEFVRLAAQKICAIKIPLAAVCYKYSRPDLLTGWTNFLDLFGCWHQMSNDLFHWYEDASADRQSYFLAEALRRKQATESIAEWVTRDGFAWGMSVLDGWMNELQVQAQALHSAELTDYLQFRSALLRREADEVLQALQLASNLRDLFF